MAAIKVLAGDFVKFAHNRFGSGQLLLTPADDYKAKARTYKLRDFKELELADEQAGVKVFGAAAWGAVGILLAGPLGMLAGAVLSGRGAKVTFVAVTANGRKLMAQCDKATWLKMQACRF